MAHRSLSDFLEKLQEKEELRRIAVEVSSDEELAEITDRVARSANTAQLFERVAGFRQPVITNLFGTERRICLGLEAQSLAEVIERFGKVLRNGRGEGLLDRLKPQESGGALAPKKVKTAACQQVVRLGSDIDLGQFPAPRSHCGDARRQITAGVLHWRDPATRVRRFDHAQIEILDRSRLGLHVGGTSALAQHLAEARSGQQHTPIAVTLGGDPSHWIAASLPAFVQVDAAVIAGSLRAAPLELVTCRTHDLEVPADVEFVLEGHVDPQQSCTSGALANEWGWQTEPHELAVLELGAVTHRTNPIWPAAIIGQPPHELCAWRRFVQRLLLPVVQLLAPEVVDYHFPDEGAAASLGFVAIAKRYPQQASKVASLLWGLDPWAGTKFLIVVDDDVDVHDAATVWRHVAANVCPPRDVQQQSGPAGAFDHATPLPGIGGRVLFDATRKLPGEHPRPWPNEAERSAAVRELVSGRWAQYGLGKDRPR